MKNVIIIVCLSVALLFIGNRYYKLEKENERVENNFSEIQKTNSTLTLTVKEFKENLKLSNHRLDSTLKANKIKPKRVQEATTIKETYRDTTVKVFPVSPVPVLVKSGGISFNVQVSDSLKISDVSYTNNITLIAYYKIRWLFWRKYEYKAITDNGEIEIDRIIIKRK